MTEMIDSFAHAGLIVEIHHDDDPTSPRENDNLSTMAWDGLGHDQPGFTVELHAPETDVCPRCKGDGDRTFLITTHDAPRATIESASMALREVYVDCALCDGACEVELSTVAGIKQEYGSRVVLAYRYDERSYGMLNSCEHDHEYANVWVFDTPERVKETMGECTDDDVRAALVAETDELRAYLAGYVYGYVIKGPDHEDIGTLIGPNADDSCWGFIDADVDRPDSYTRQQAREAAESCAELLERERVESAYWAACDVVTV